MVLSLIRWSPVLCVAALCAACAPAGRVVLLPQSNASSAVVVTTASGSAQLNTPYAAADLGPAGGKPLPPHMADAIRNTMFYVLPRMSPDGAEAILNTGRYVRSSPVNERANQSHTHWVASDVDGDGLMATMRQQDPHGEVVELRGDDGVPLNPPVMVPRLPEDVGPFYKLYPEGLIANFDGQHIPDPYFLGDNQYDFNRNFSHHWKPEPEQAGAGH